MAYIKFPTVTDAMFVLMRMHNHKMGSRWLRVSFSSKDAQSFDAANQNSGGSGSNAGAGSYSAAASSSSASAAGQPSMPSTGGASNQQDGDAGME